MKLAVYEEIRAAVIGGDDKAIQIARAKHPTVSFDTVVSIHAQESSKRIRLNHHRLKSEARVQEYMRRYASGEDILDLSQEYGMPPCLLARFLLEHLVGVPRGSLGACLKDPTAIPSTPVFFTEGKTAANKRAPPGTKTQTAGRPGPLGDVQAGADVAVKDPPPGIPPAGQRDAALKVSEVGLSSQGIGKKSSGWGVREEVEGNPNASDRASERLPPGNNCCQVADPIQGAPQRGSQDAPGGAVPGGRVPGDAVPGGRVPDDSVPGGSVPGGGVPGGDVEVTVDRIRSDVYRCVENDSVSSPAVEVIRRVAGLEYEALLYSYLRKLKIPFQSEEELRAAGFSKTPDAKLDVPIVVKGRPVWWIDSKACFGDEYNHKTQVTEQFERYINRFGPGMVIYWFGFIDDLNTHPEILLMEDMPKSEDIIQLECLPIPTIELMSEFD